jgi:hypothetical protein
MITLTSALEAWLLDRGRETQTYRLARHVAWFGCGLAADDLCGRSRPICPYLKLDPTSEGDRRRLSALRELGQDHTAWRCSEWHRVIDWHDARSGAAHGDPLVATVEEADEAEYWIAHYLAEPILEWIASHQDDPIGHLQAVMSAMPSPSNWPQVLAAISSRSSSPPAL